MYGFKMIFTIASIIIGVGVAVSGAPKDHIVHAGAFFGGLYLAVFGLASFVNLLFGDDEL